MKTKLIFLFTSFLTLTFSLSSQTTSNIQQPTSINTDGAAPDESAILDVQSALKGLLTPRMTTAQRTSIATPATGLLVFDNSTESFWFYNGNAWEELQSGNISELADADDDTKVQVEESADEDIIRFDVAGTEVATLTATSLNAGRLNADTVNASVYLNLPSGSSAPDSMWVDMIAAGVVADGSTDNTALINAIIAANNNRILYFAEGQFIANIDVTQNVTLLGGNQVTITSASAEAPTLKVSTDCKLVNMKFVNTNAAGIGIEVGPNLNVTVQDCYFKGFEHATSSASDTSSFRNCDFEIVDAGGTSIGTKCWSNNATYTDCRFFGKFGADVQDAKFYNCDFRGDWGLHMPLGAVDNTGANSGYLGNGEFWNCTFESTGGATYAAGMGNDAHPVFHSCEFRGNQFGVYLRTQSTVELYDCYIEAKNTTSGAAGLKFAKYRTAGQNSIGLVDDGISVVNGCVIAGGQFSVVVPASAGKGSMTMTNTIVDNAKFLAEDSGGNPDDFNLFYLYCDNLTNGNSPVIQTEVFTGGATTVFAPKFNNGNFAFVDCSSSSTSSADVRLTRFYRKPDRFFPPGFQVMFRGSSNTQKTKIKHGYYAPEGTLVSNLSGADIELGANEWALYVYYTNTWVQISGTTGYSSFAPPIVAALESQIGEVAAMKAELEEIKKMLEKTAMPANEEKPTTSGH